MTTGEELKQEGMARAAAGAGSWIVQAERAGITIARKRAEFTTDAIWALLDKRGVLPPRETRAMGPVMRDLMRRGACVNTGRYVQSKRPECHMRPITVYRSLLCQ